MPQRAALAAVRRRRLLLFVEGFVAAASFEGARTGVAFKTGSMGLGYYPRARIFEILKSRKMVSV